jgi:hypothetical protein
MIGYRCDLDLCFILTQGLLQIPFVTLLRLMKKALSQVEPKIKEVGLFAAIKSRPFLAKQWPRPNHVLTELEKSLKLRDKNLEVEAHTGETEAKVDQWSSQFSGLVVEGHMSEMLLLEDGTLVPMDINRKSTPRPKERAEYEQPKRSGRGTRPQPSPGDSKIDTLSEEVHWTHWAVRERLVPSAIPEKPRAGPSRRTEGQPTPPLAEGFEYLWGRGSASMSADNVERNRKENRPPLGVKLAWPPPAEKHHETDERSGDPVDSKKGSRSG